MCCDMGVLTSRWSKPYIWLSVVDRLSRPWGRRMLRWELMVKGVCALSTSGSSRARMRKTLFMAQRSNFGMRWEERPSFRICSGM